MKKYSVALGSVIGGMLITLLTGLYNSTPNGLLGAAWFGWPFTWVRRLVVAPQYSPWAFDVTGFAKDFVVWAVVLAVLIVIIQRLTGRDRASGTKST